MIALTLSSTFVDVFHCEEEPFWNLGQMCGSGLDKRVGEVWALQGTDREEAEVLFMEAKKLLMEDAHTLLIWETEKRSRHELRDQVVRGLPGVSPLDSALPVAAVGNERVRFREGGVK